MCQQKLIPRQLIQTDKNRKGIIRKKAFRLAVRNGEVYYKKKKNEVCYKFTARVKAIAIAS